MFLFSVTFVRKLKAYNKKTFFVRQLLRSANANISTCYWIEKKISVVFATFLSWV